MKSGKICKMVKFLKTIILEPPIGLFQVAKVEGEIVSVSSADLAISFTETENTQKKTMCHDFWQTFPYKTSWWLQPI